MYLDIFRSSGKHNTNAQFNWLISLFLKMFSGDQSQISETHFNQVVFWKYMLYTHINTEDLWSVKCIISGKDTNLKNYLKCLYIGTVTKC